MKIGIDASRAFVGERTGIEEYSYQVIKNLKGKLDGHQVVLYIKKSQKSKIKSEEISDVDNVFFIPGNWQIRIISFPWLWTQLGLSLEMLMHPVDALFIPAHTVPWIHPARNALLFRVALLIQRILKFLHVKTDYNTHSDAGGPKNTYVTVHGLEYEILPEAYSFWERIYMRLSIRKSCLWAKKIIAVSENTKKDLLKLYKVPEEKIEVIYEGVPEKLQITNYKLQINSKFKIQNSKFLLYIGRLEERKNIIGIIRAFEILKEHYKIPHKLVLAGKFGYGEEKIRRELRNVNCPKDIILAGFVSEEEKWSLMKNAAVFLFPTFYEGFGLPVLEAQAVGVPVVAGDNSSILEITKLPLLPLAGNFSVILVNPHNAEEIADAAYKIISDDIFRNDIIKKGSENVKRFSWDKCAEEIAELMEAGKTLGSNFPPARY